MKITGFSIRRPIFTIVGMILFLLLGVVSLLNIPLKLIPDIDPPIAAVVTSYQGASPEEVVDKVTRPLEDNLSTIPGLKNITSQSMEGVSLSLLEFSWTASIDDVETDIITRMNQTPLPSDAGNPQFLKFDPSQLPVIQFTLRSDMADTTEFQDLVHDLELELARVEGVASIDVSGNIIEEIQVKLDQEQLRDYGLSQDDVVGIIQGHNVTMPGGTVESGDLRLTTRVISLLTSVDDVKDIVVTVDMATGDEIQLRDISTVEIAPETVTTITRTNNESSVMLSMQQQADANTAMVSTAFNERLNDLLDESKYEDIEVAILFDQGDFVKEAIGNVSNALVLGGLFAMLVLFLFLRNFKSPFIIGIAIPFSIIVTFVLMYFTNFTLNIMTLGGLALGIGMLVDNSIVVIENIYRHLSMGKDSKKAALDGTKEVASAIAASTFTTISVFLPVLFITGIIGNLFREFALTVSFSLFASLVVALTVVPMIASRILKAPKEDQETKRQNSSFLKGIEKAVRWSLKRRFVVIIITFTLLVVGAVGVTQVGLEFIPASDEGFFTVDVELEHGTALEITDEVVSRVEEVLEDKSEIQDYLSVIGSSDGFSGGASGHEAQLFISMVPQTERNETTMEFAESIRRDLQRAAGDDAEVTVNLQASFGGAPNTLSFVVTDSDKNRLDEAVELLRTELEDVDDIEEVTNNREETVPEIQISVDEEAARENGFAPAQIANVVNSVTRGAFATQMVDESTDHIYEVHVSYDDEVLASMDRLGELLIRNQAGEYIELAELTEITEGDGPVAINRQNQREAVEFSLRFSSSTNLGVVSTNVMEKIDDLNLDEATEIRFTGDQELLDDTMGDLMFAFLLAIVFVYLVMAAQFESFKYPFVIMFSIPLVIIGVMIGLTATQTPLSIMAFIGLIVLAGIVVNNAIVLVDYINQKKASGVKSYDAIIEAVKDRARPILMTAITTILGLVPLALGLGEGTEMQQPLGITVIGGLISSTFLTLFFIPVVYSFFDKNTRNLNKKYITTDGQLIPAYLIEERVVEKEREEDTKEIKHEERMELNEGYKDEDTLPSTQKSDDLSKEELLFLLEKIIDKGKGKKEDNDEK
ncbi:efflux RND transporter permease subunit [Alkalihalobacillus sp. LMS39]|uniref:efflux RND transporter permease subunit n=1 Tax=Alkalihalobacillus sp. LMS39 TaxID=2924032 RepID=UPI001FB31C8A|nr:efflux RND transporter permease subunit [Alkalihalobacillus sp. LMS39]UOE92560.1 efflux RND transporter permease subunit [Alkalihalobacillus sp. LMS39]